MIVSLQPTTDGCAAAAAAVHSKHTCLNRVDPQSIIILVHVTHRRR